MKKIMLICGASHTVLNFRSSLISALIENNCEVAVVALDSEKKDEIEKLGVKVFVCGENKKLRSNAKKPPKALRRKALIGVALISAILRKNLGSLAAQDSRGFLR
mgnify:CR=1 FL=1